MTRADIARRQTDFVQSIAHGLKVLEAFSPNALELGATELARRTDIELRTVHRVVWTLERLGYLVKNQRTRKYRLGMRVLHLGFTVLDNIPLRDVARPYLENLLHRVGENANLAVLDGTEIVYLDRLEVPEIRLVLNVRVGSRIPAYRTALGKAILAFLPEAELEHVIRATQFEVRTPNTLTSAEALRRELAEVRERGFAINNEESFPGHRAIAAPIRSHNGVVIASIGIGGASSVLTLDQLTTVIPHAILEAAAAISAQIGYA